MSKFRTTEISNPKFESNNLRFITVKTPNLNGRGNICVFIPPFKNLKNIPIVTLLHGVYGSNWVWTQKAGVHFTALEMMEKGLIKPMILAMPSDGLWGDGSGYIEHKKQNFERWIVDDVVNAIIENIEITSDASPLFITGLSMGGFGALKLGVKYSKKYTAISAHSAITDLQQMELFVEENLDNFIKEESSVLKEILKNRNLLPKFRFDCGKEDLLIEYNRILHQKLKEENIQHTYQEFKGKHEWSYWQEHIKDTLLFFNQF